MSTHMKLMLKSRYRYIYIRPEAHDDMNLPYRVTDIVGLYVYDRAADIISRALWRLKGANREANT
jgi:hypothetical protein